MISRCRISASFVWKEEENIFLRFEGDANIGSYQSRRFGVGCGEEIFNEFAPLGRTARVLVRTGIRLKANPPDGYDK